MLRYQEALSLINDHHQDVIKALEDYFDQMFNGDFHNRPDLAGSSQEKLQNILDSQLQENELAKFTIAINSPFSSSLLAMAKSVELVTNNFGSISLIIFLFGSICSP
jgi:hypothetical protein